MRKFALLLAAALAVSAPLAATMTTDTYAAAKKAKKAAKKEAAKKEAAGPEAPFSAILRAMGDLGHQLATNVYVYNPDAGKGGKDSGKKSAGKKKAKKA